MTDKFDDDDDGSVDLQGFWVKDDKTGLCTVQMRVRNLSEAEAIAINRKLKIVVAKVVGDTLKVDEENQTWVAGDPANDRMN